MILQGQGMAGMPSEDLGGQTPLQAAVTANLDRLARAGELGLLAISGEETGLGSEATQLALLGFDPRKYHQGRGPFEAAGLGVELGEHDVAYRCNMVTLRVNPPHGGASGNMDVKKLGPQVLMDDPQAGGIETEEARELIDAVNEQLGSESLQFYPGSGYRHLMVWVEGKARAVCVDPERVVGRPIGAALPTGDGADILKQVMEASLIILRDHPVNEDRRQAGKKPANCLWLWGQGRTPNMPKLTDRYQIAGAIVSRSDLHRGIGICAGLEAVAPETLGDGSGAGGVSQVEAALHELEKKGFAYVHVEAPADVDRGADGKAKVRALEEFDRTVVGPLVEGLSRFGPHRLLVVCDPVAPGESSPGVGSTVPYVIYQGPAPAPAGQDRRFTEAHAEATGVVMREATRLLPKLLARG